MLALLLAILACAGSTQTQLPPKAPFIGYEVEICVTARDIGGTIRGIPLKPQLSITITDRGGAESGDEINQRVTHRMSDPVNVFCTEQVAIHAPDLGAAAYIEVGNDRSFKIEKVEVTYRTWSTIQTNNFPWDLPQTSNRAGFQYGTIVAKETENGGWFGFNIIGAQDMPTAIVDTTTQ